MIHLDEQRNSDFLLPTASYSIQSVIPQPSRSSIKVVEQLRYTYESLVREIENTKAQIQDLQRTKAEHDETIAHYTELNKQHRCQITQIMETLEDKQRLVDATKEVSIQLEHKVKQLKQEAIQSRDWLDGLRKQERRLEHDKSVTMKENHQVKHQTDLIHSSIDQFSLRCGREMSLLEMNLKVIHDQTTDTIERTKLCRLIELKLNERQEGLSWLMETRLQLKSNTQSVIEIIKKELQETWCT
ncbi:hypothetical protein BDB01DRAFT_838119 [Pilobolus umbonatus]|nr:hypothetical protein BDB01DRAFT_838119 [Pilobolus umbonatus]